MSDEEHAERLRELVKRDGFIHQTRYLRFEGRSRPDRKTLAVLVLAARSDDPLGLISPMQPLLKIVAGAGKKQYCRHRPYQPMPEVIDALMAVRRER